MEDRIDVESDYIEDPNRNFIGNWVQKKKKKNPYYFLTAFAIIWAIVTVGVDSNNIGQFFYDAFAMLFGSALVCAFAFVVFMSNIEDDQILNVSYLLWAVIALMGVYGGFWVF